MGLRAAPLVFVALVSGVATFLLVYQGRLETHAGKIAFLAYAAIFAASVVGLAWLRARWRRRGSPLRTSTLLKTVAGCAAVAYVGVVAVLYFAQDRLLYVPVAGRFDDCPIASEHGFTFFRQDSAGPSVSIRAMVRRTDIARAWLIVFHGNAESACRGIPYYTSFLDDLPLNWAIAEYPGYRGDPVPPSEKRILASALALFDAISAQNRAKLPIYVLGRSLGTGVATYVAAERPVSGLILLSPYTSIADVAAYQYPFIPVHWLLHDTYPAAEWARQVQAPTLVFHGDRDRVIPISMGKREAGNFRDVHRVVIHGTAHDLLRPQFEHEIRPELVRILKY